MSRVRELANDAEFAAILEQAGPRLLVVDFTATWCGPCQRIAPVFAELSNKYPGVMFLKVDGDKCKLTAQGNGVTGFPTFQFYKMKVKLEQFSGANAEKLEQTIVKYKGDDEADGAAAGGSSGYGSLGDFIDKRQAECLNENDDHPFANALRRGDGTHLESDCDEQLIMTVPFTQPVKIHSLNIKARADGSAPKTLKLFVNPVNSMDFADAESAAATQEFELSPADLTGDNNITLRFVKFQNVLKLSLFFKDNQGDEDVTVIEDINFIGAPLQGTDMSKFERVSGKKGEAHG